MFIAARKIRFVNTTGRNIFPVRYRVTFMALNIPGRLYSLVGNRPAKLNLMSNVIWTIELWACGIKIRSLRRSFTNIFWPYIYQETGRSPNTWLPCPFSPKMLGKLSNNNIFRNRIEIPNKSLLSLLLCSLRRTHRYKVKRRKVLCLQACEALWSNWKRT